MVSGTYRRVNGERTNPAMKMATSGSNIHVTSTKNPGDREPRPGLQGIWSPQFSVPGAENGKKHSLFRKTVTTGFW